MRLIWNRGMIEKEVAGVYVKVSTRWLVNRMHSFGGF